jgi:hypothetical protein
LLSISFLPGLSLKKLVKSPYPNGIMKVERTEVRAKMNRKELSGNQTEKHIVYARENRQHAAKRRNIRMGEKHAG